MLMITHLNRGGRPSQFCIPKVYAISAMSDSMKLEEKTLKGNGNVLVQLVNLVIDESMYVLDRTEESKGEQINCGQ